MAEKAYYVTEEGREALEKELDYLKVVRRKEGKSFAAGK